MKDNETCFFLSSGLKNRCALLSGTECTGTRTKKLCAFFKTEEEYIEEYNRAVDLNRAKGNCARCKYKRQQCSKLTKRGDERFDS